MKRRSKMTRLWSAVLAVVMMLGMFPVQAMAYTKDAEPTASALTESDKTTIKELLINNDSISFDSNKQTFLMIDVDAVQSEHLASLNIYQAEERIKEHELTFDVSIDDTPVGRDQTYYLISQEDNKIERATVSDTFKMAANSGKVAVFILDKGKTYSVSYDISDCYYTKEAWKDENGNTYNGNEFTCRPMNGKTITEYNGTAEDDPAIASFSFEWDLSNYLDIEIWMADTIRKQMENPGWGFPDNATGYVNFLIELRDADGNISRLPTTYFNNYGNNDLYNVMHEDGVISIPLSFYDDKAEDGSPYGEFDIYIPFGYDYRITLLSYSVDTLGGYAYYYNQEHTPDTDDFCVTDKSLTGQDEWGSFLEFTFMPMNKEIRIEKTVEGNEPQNAEYEFQVTELVPSFVDKYNDAGYQNGYEKTDDLYQTLGDYPYELYDAKTGNRIDDGMLKTDMEGCFSMRADQYAVFKTWGLPKDFDDYTGGGFHIKGIYDAFSKDISMESRYIVNEVESPDCTTTITHTHNGIETKVGGKRIEDVYGGDKLLYQNVFMGDPAGSTGSLTISKKVTGTGTPDADTLFEFTVTKDKTVAVGQYSVNGGDAQPIPADGKISIKAGQSAVLTGLEPGEYTVTETSPTQANYKSTSFSVNNGEVQNGLSATVTVTGAAAAAGGWSKKDGMPIQDADGYFTYTITSDQIDADGKITVDCDLLAEYMEAQMQEYLNLSPRNFKVKFVNQTGAPIQYQDYRFDTVNWIPVGQTYTPSDTPSMENQFEFGWGDVWQQVYPFVAGQTETAGSLDVKGFDGNNIRLAISPLRCINPAVISYFDSNPGKTENLTDKTSVSTAGYITLKQMNALPELIKKAFTFKNWEGNEINLEADANRTYADFICAFYGVNSLNDLTIAQKYNVLGTGGKGSPSLQESKYKGQSAITTYYSIVAPMTNRYIPSGDLDGNTLNYFKTWGFGKVSTENDYAYEPDFYIMENDPEVLKMAYDYLYSRCIRFSLDSNDRTVSTAIDNSATSNDGVGGIKDYMDKTDAATANVRKAMNDGAAIADGESITLDNVKGYIEVPNAWNQFRAYDFGFKLMFKGEKKSAETAAVSFTNTYQKSSSPSHGGDKPSLNTKDHYGYIIGYPVDYYTGEPTTDQTKKPVRPEGNITRAEVATIYFRMLTDESRTKFWSQSSPYADVKKEAWFNNAVCTLSNAGIINGYEDGSFRPNGYITRAEFATIAARFFDATYDGKDLFPDIDGHWAKDYINKAADKGFVNGYEDGTFRPDRNITRAEAVTLVNRTLDRHPDQNYFTKDMLVWPDNMDTTKWYYADMQEATNSHKYQMLTKSDKSKYEKWTKTLPIRDWEAFEKAWSDANSSKNPGNVV